MGGVGDVPNARSNYKLNLMAYLRVGATSYVPLSDARSDYISLVLKTNGNNQYKKIGNHNIQDSRFVFSDTYFYTINGRFSNVPSATRTFTSSIIKTESGVRAA